MIAVTSLAQKCEGLVSLACNYSTEVFADKLGPLQTKKLQHWLLV